MTSWPGHNVNALYTYCEGVRVPGRHWRPSHPAQRPGQRQQCWHGYHASAAFLQPADTNQPHVLLKYTMHVTCFVFGYNVTSHFGHAQTAARGLWQPSDTHALFTTW